MNTQCFIYALEVERTRSITKAAENLYMAQPNLSKAIKELEASLGITIFTRSPKGVVPTKKGAEFLNCARGVMSQIENMQQLWVEEAPLGQSLRISIPRASYVADAFTRVAATLNYSGDIDLAIQETNATRAIENVAEGRSNLGVIRYRVDYEDYFLDVLAGKNLASQTILHFEYLILLSAEHPLAHKAEIRAEELAPYVEVVYGDRDIPDRPNAANVATSGRKRISVYDRCGQFDTLSSIKSAFAWSSRVPQRLLERYTLVQRPCSNRRRARKDALIHLKQYQFTDIDKLFLTFLYESRDALV